MTIISTTYIVVLLIGLVLYLIPFKNAKISELGRIMFFVGLLWLVYHLSGTTHIKI